MATLTALGLQYTDAQIMVLDQRLLPGKLEWNHCQSPHHMYEMIQTLQIRGAPLIGVAAALALAHFYQQTPHEDYVHDTIALLNAARPTAVNLSYCLTRMKKAIDEDKDPQAVLNAAINIFQEDVSLCAAIGKHGATLINDGDHILTHCNAGGLATAGIGTAVGVLKTAWQQGKQIHVFVNETRPLLQGARLTAWELEQAGIPYTLICDNMAATLMAKQKINKVILGADRIAANGDFANKIGTYQLAIAAHYHHVPFYTAAPYTTIDNNTACGEDIVIEQRPASEVRGIKGYFGDVCWSPEMAATYNPAFDVTPAKLLTAIICEKGIIHHMDALQNMLEHI